MIDERKVSKQRPPAPTASAVRPCPALIQISRTPGTVSLPSTVAPPDHLLRERKLTELVKQVFACVALMLSNTKIV